MRTKILTIWVSFSFFFIAYTQTNDGIPVQGRPGFGQTDLYPNKSLIISQPGNVFSHYENFYRKNMNANFLISSKYSGISASLLNLKNEQLSLGFSMQINQILSSNENVRELYGAIQPSGQNYFVPLLLTIKLHLRQNAEVNDFVPYLITGLGPAFGLYMPYGNFFQNLTAISGEIGGGGFVGTGVDFFWQEEWAISFDVRYNLYLFANPLGDDQDYKGVSFFLGFSKALDY